MPLAAFIAEHRDELIGLGRARVAARSSPPPTHTEIDYGVPLLLIQLDTAISAEDFRTLNQCLDDAIAGAVTEFAKEQDSGRDGELSELGRRWCHRRSGPPQLCVFARVCGSSRSGCLTNGCFLCRPLRS